MATYWTREEEYLQEQAACEQEAFETFCEEQGIDPDSDKAASMWQGVKEEDAIRAYEENQAQELDWRRQDEQDYLDSLG